MTVAKPERGSRLVLAFCADLLCTAADAQTASPAGDAAPSAVSLSAPPSVYDLLAKHLDLPAQLAGDDAQQLVLTRRAGSAAAALLATEGHFAPRIEVRRTDGDAAGLVVDVDPGPRLRLGAQLRADASYIAELESGPPQLAEDIVVLGRKPAEGRAPRIESDIDFDLGEHFHLCAGGLAARLAGRLRVRGGDGPGAGRLAATGSIAARDATFEAYGQRLVVERGIVNFQGPLDDPGLDVLALRKGGAVEAGVAVTGTARQPRVRLVSTPPVSDAEKLSWIVLGRAPDSGSTDSALLLAAAGAILGGQGEGVPSQLAQAFGVDEPGLRQGSSGDPLTGQILVLGKRLSAHLPRLRAGADGGDRSGEADPRPDAAHFHRHAGRGG